MSLSCEREAAAEFFQTAGQSLRKFWLSRFWRNNCRLERTLAANTCTALPKEHRDDVRAVQVFRGLPKKNSRRLAKISREKNPNVIALFMFKQLKSRKKSLWYNTRV
jgi:hypothetical protein